MWENYKNLSKRSGVLEYMYDEIQGDWIKVKFKDGSIYSYTSLSADPFTILLMIAKAQDGLGLNRFINKYQPGYEYKTY